MPKVLCELENASGLINGIEFVPHEDGMRSISKEDVGEPHLSIFLSIPGYSVDESGEKNEHGPSAAPAEKPETAAQRKARLKAEQEAADKAKAEQEAAAKAEADRLAEEEAQRKAAEEAAKKSDQDSGNGTEGTGNDQGEVF